MLTVIGAGAIGMLLSAYLSEAGFTVQLVARSERQAELINQFGLTLIKETGHFRYPVFTTTSLDPEESNQLLIIAVKSYDLREMGPFLSKIDRQTPLLFIQNGLAHLEYIKEIPHQNIAFGSIEHGAYKVDMHTVKHTGIGSIRLTMVRGNDSDFKTLLRANRNDFPIQMETDAEKVLLRKVILNSLINPLTAILQVKNGELLKGENVHLLERLYTEIISVFPEMVDHVTFDDVLDLCKRTASNHSSMLADRMAGRRTEIDAITGGLIRMAEQRGRALPSIEVLHSLVKALEERGDRNG